MISYKPFWETLRLSAETTYTLIKNHHISSSTIDKLRKDKPITQPPLMTCAGFWYAAWKIFWYMSPVIPIKSYKEKIPMQSRNSVCIGILKYRGAHFCEPRYLCYVP